MKKLALKGSDNSTVVHTEVVPGTPESTRGHAKTLIVPLLKTRKKKLRYSELHSNSGWFLDFQGLSGLPPILP